MVAAREEWRSSKRGVKVIDSNVGAVRSSDGTVHRCDARERGSYVTSQGEWSPDDRSRAREGTAREDAAHQSHIALRHPERVADVAALVVVHVTDLGVTE